jgi:hypothetical protein
MIENYIGQKKMFFCLKDVFFNKELLTNVFKKNSTLTGTYMRFSNVTVESIPRWADKDQSLSDSALENGKLKLSLRF